MTSKANPLKILVFTVFTTFFAFCGAAAARDWDGGQTRMEKLSGEIKAYVQQIRANYLASAGLQNELKTLVENHSDSRCSAQFETFLNALDALAVRAAQTGAMNPDAIPEFRRIFDDERLLACPEGMVLIEGIFCIDRHEYPGKTGAPPKGGFSWSDAARLCADAGKYLCSGTEWLRACRGNTACSETFFSPDYDPAKCGLQPQYTSPSPSWRIEDRPECASAYGVDDLAGGLWEWTDEEFRANLKVLRMGASVNEPVPTCDETIWAAPDARVDYAGFRCCSAPLTKPNEAENQPAASPPAEPEKAEEKSPAENPPPESAPPAR